MLDSDTIAVLKQQHDDTKEPFESMFKSERRDYWDALINRTWNTSLPPQIKDYARDVDIKTPALRAALEEHVKILTLNLTRIDVVSIDERTRAKEDVAEVANWLAWWLRELDRGRDASKTRHRMQEQYGVAVERLHWKMPEEPDVYDDKDAKTVRQVVDVANRAMRRSEEYKKRKPDTWHLEFVNPLSMCWFPLTDPSLVFEEAVISYQMAKTLENKSHEKFRLGADNKGVFVGDKELVDFQEATRGQAKKIHIIIRAMRDGERWTVSEYIYPDGDFGNIQELNEYDVPFGHCPYFITPGGEENRLATDPHFRYWPGMMEPLFVLYAERNSLNSIIMALTLKQALDQNIYIDASTIPLDVMTMLEEQGLIEGSGAKRRFVIKRTEPGVNEIPLSPHLERWPNIDMTMLYARLETLNQEILQHQPNRFLTGRAWEETKEGTATMGLGMLQAAGLPYGGYLNPSDRTWQDIFEAMIECVLAWDEGVEDSGSLKPYTITSDGNLPLSKGKATVGEVTITAEKLRREMNINVLTKGETAEEQRLRHADAQKKFDRGEYTDIELYEALDYDDPYDHQKELAEYNAWKVSQPLTQQAIQAAIAIYMQATTGLDIASIMGSQGGQMQQQAAKPAPTESKGMKAPAVGGPTGGSSTMVSP